MSNGENKRIHKPPPLLAGAVLIFWGVMTGNYFVGSFFAILYESHRVIKTRWVISDELFERIWQFCFISFFIFLGVGMFRVGPLQVFYLALVWTPALLLPLAVAQVYCDRDAVPASVFSLITKYIQKVGRPAGGKKRNPTVINIEYFYLLMVVMSASSANKPGPIFYFIAAWLFFWAVWQNPDRPRTSPAMWAFALFLVTAVGYFGQLGLRQLHLYLERNAFFLNLTPPGAGLSRGTTRIGSVGKIKLSPAVHWRLRPRSGTPPAYLRSATYNLYGAGLWFIRGTHEWQNAGKAVPVDNKRWTLQADSASGPLSSALIMGGSSRGKAQLALPGNTRLLDDLDAESVTFNSMSAVIAKETPRILHFTADYGKGLGSDKPPSKDDLHISKREEAVLTRISDKIGLAGTAPTEAVKKIAAFFRDNFSYTTWLTIEDRRGTSNASAIQIFLERARRGHCEYFATATVLLLRKAGIPARYVTGYAVNEYNERTQEYIVRGLHGHAWSQAWIDGRWQYIDNTPPDWNAVESETMSAFQPFKDWLANVPHAFILWRDTPAGRKTITIFKWASLPLIAIYLWFRLFHGQRGRRSRAGQERREKEQITRHGADSEYYALEQRLAELGEVRPPGLPAKKWWAGISSRYPSALAEKIKTAVDLHYRHRFTSEGLDEKQRDKLRAITEQCASELQKAEPKQSF